MRTNRLHAPLLAGLLLLGCTPGTDPEPSANRSFAPRILGIPNCSYVLVEVSTSPLGTATSNGSYVRRNDAPVGAKSVQVDGLPPTGPLYFRVSGLDSDHATPLWSSNGPVPDGTTPSVTIGGNGISIATLEKPTLHEVATATTSGAGVQIQCTQGWPVWTVDGSMPGIGNPGNSSSLNQMSSTQVGATSGTTLTARCTNGYVWSPANSWRYEAATSALPDTFLPQVQFRAYPGSTGNLGFVLPSGATMARYSNWQVVYQVNGGNTQQVSFNNPSQSYAISGPSSVTAWLVAWDDAKAKWVGGAQNSITLPVAVPGPGGPLPAPSISVPGSNGGFLNFTIPSVAGNYQDWSVMIQTVPQTTWSQYSMNPVFNGFNLGPNTSISAYYVAWDANNFAWVSSPQSSAASSGTIPPADPAGPLPKLQVVSPAGSGGYVSFGQPSASDLTLYTEWKALVQMNGSGTWEPKNLTESFPFSGGSATLVGYLAAWNSTTGSWVTGPLDTTSISAYAVSLSAPSFLTNYGNPLTGTYLLDSNAIAIQITLAGVAANIVYTTDGSDPAPATSPNWNGAMNSIPFPPEKDSVVVKAMAVSGNQISPVAALLVRRPRWTRVDLSPVGCLRQVGATKVYACGDSRGPLTWQSSGWVAVDPTWSHGTVQALYVSDTEMVAVAGAQVWRALRNGTFMPVGSAFSASPVQCVARWGDSLWVGANDGIYEWTGSSWNLVPGTPSGATQLWAGSDALWAGAGNQIWRLYWTGTGRNWTQWTGTSGTVTGFVENPWYTGASNGPLALSMDALSEIDLVHFALSGNAITDALPAHQGLRQACSWNSRLYAAFDDGNGVGGIAKTSGWGTGWTRVGSGWPSPSSTPAAAAGVAVYRNQTAQLIASTPSGTWTLPLP